MRQKNTVNARNEQKSEALCCVFQRIILSSKRRSITKNIKHDEKNADL